MSEIVCPECGAIATRPEIASGICSNCGSQLPRLRPVAARVESSPALSKKLVYLIVGFGSAICVLLLVVVALLVGNRGANSSPPVAPAAPAAPAVAEPAAAPGAAAAAPLPKEVSPRIGVRAEEPRTIATLGEVAETKFEKPAPSPAPATIAPDTTRASEVGKVLVVEQIPIPWNSSVSPMRPTNTHVWLVVCLKTQTKDVAFLKRMLMVTPEGPSTTPLYYGTDTGAAVPNGLPDLPTTLFASKDYFPSKAVSSLVFLIPRTSHGGTFQTGTKNEAGPTLSWTVPERTGLAQKASPFLPGTPQRNDYTVSRPQPSRFAKPTTSVIETPLAVRGEAWSHQLVDRDGGDTFRLEKAPAGMTVTPTGALAWRVPPRFSGSEEVLVEVTNGDARRFIKFPLKAGRKAKDGVVEVERLAKMTDDQEYLPLDGKVARAAVSKEGRYVVCGIPEKKRLAVVDLVELKEIASIDWPLSDKPAGFAVGGERVVVYDRERELLNVYKLKTGTRENSFRNPFPQSICDLVMGRNEDDAVFCAATESSADAQVDALTLPQGRRMNLVDKPSQEISGYALRMIADKDLSIITMYRTTVSPQGAILLQRTGNKYSFAYAHSSYGVLFPMSGQELLGTNVTYGFDLKPRMSFKTGGTFSDGMRPVLGSDLLLGISDGKVYYFARNRPEPLRQWTVMPGRSTGYRPYNPVARWLNGKSIEGIQLSATIGRGYILPGDAPGIVVVLSDSTVTVPPALATGGTFKVIPGSKWSEKIATLGSTKGLHWMLERNPAGLTVAPDGTLNWDVPPDFHGSLECDLAIQGADGADRRKLTFTAGVCALSDPKTWKASPGLVALDSAAALVAGAPGSAYAAVARGAELFSLDAKTLRPLLQATLPDAAVRMQIRGDDAIVVTAKQLIVYSLSTLKPRTMVKLPCSDASDLAVHPSQRISWVAGTDPAGPNGFKSHRILQVNESTGNAVWLDGAFGRMLGISPDGKTLYAGIKEDFHDSAVIVDMWGQAYHLTQYGSVDLLMSYSLYGAAAKPKQLHERPGENMQKIVVSPDGRHVSPIAGGGYRAGHGAQNGYTIPALQTGDLVACDAAFNTDAYPKFIAYHPTLDVVVAGNDKLIRAFDLKTGVARGPDLGAPEGMKSVSFAFFGGDLTKVCVLGTHREHGTVLIAIDLALDDAEKRKAGAVQARSITEAPASLDKSSAPPPVPPKPAVKVKLSQIGALSQGANVSAMPPKDVAEKFNTAVVVITHADGSGSGFLISDDGFIATCAHVLPRRSETAKIQIQHLGKTLTLDASIVMRDDAQDLALLKATPGFTCKYVRFEQTKAPQMGEEVTIIGNPGLGDTILSNTMTQGIVSNPSRQIEDAAYIQTTAAVNPGTSGSPLFNSFGNVIGLVTLKGRIEAAGFAVPVERIKAFIERCCDAGK